MNRKVFYALGILLFLVVGLAASLVLVRRQQDIRSKAAGCDGRWPADPATACGRATQAPAQGATNVSLTPNFHWDYGGYRPEDNNQCVTPSGCGTYGVGLFLTENGASRPFASAWIQGAASAVKDAAFGQIVNCDYGNVFPNDPNNCHTDGQPAIGPLKSNTTYSWRIAPYFNGVDHALHTWNYTFTTGAPPPPPPPAPTCNSLTMTPTGTVVAVGSETRSLTANATGGSGALTYHWTTTGGTLSATSGQAVTWTAPASLGTTAQSWTISATVTDSLNRTSSVGGCTTTLSYNPPGAPTCSSLTMTPSGTTVSATGETRSLTASGAGGSGGLTYHWTSTGGTLSSATGQIVTWTAPTLGTTAQSWTISATVTDSLNQTSSIGGCTTTLTFTPGVVVVAACQKVEADKDLTKINIGDTVNFTGWGTLGASSTDVIDKIEFTLTGSTKVEVPATLDRTENNIKYFKAVKSFLIDAAGSYSMKIRIHQRDADRWYE